MDRSNRISQCYGNKAWDTQYPRGTFRKRIEGSQIVSYASCVVSLVHISEYKNSEGFKTKAKLMWADSPMLVNRFTRRCIGADFKEDPDAIIEVEMVGSYLGLSPWNRDKLKNISPETN